MQTAGSHHLAVGICHIVDDIEVAVTHNSGAEAQEVGITDVDGVGVQGVGNSNAALAGFIFHHLGADIMVQSSNACLSTHFATVNTGCQLAEFNIGDVTSHAHTGQGRLGRGDSGVIGHEDLGGNDVTVLVLGTFTSHGKGGVPQRVQNQTSLLIQGQMLDHVSGTDFVAVSPVFVGGQDTIVIHILEVQAIFHDDTAGSDTDGGAILVVEENRLQIYITDAFAFFQDVGGGDVAIAQIGIDDNRILLHNAHSLIK